MKHLLAVGSAGLLIVATLGPRHPVIQGEDPGPEESAAFVKASGRRPGSS